MGRSSSRPSCWFEPSRQPSRVFKNSSASRPRTRSSLIGVTPAGGRVPNIVVTMKWPTLAFSLVAPVCSSFSKCRRSVFRQIGLSRRSRTTKRICSSGIARPTMISTFTRCSSVGRNAGRPLIAITPIVLSVCMFLGIRCTPQNHLFQPLWRTAGSSGWYSHLATNDSDDVTGQSFSIDHGFERSCGQAT
jgi:hypothetical protein